MVSNAQESNVKQFKKLSCPEKWWVIWHPFVAKKAMKISQMARETTKIIQQQKLLRGSGNGDQVDAFRHTFWMANLTRQIGWRKAKKLGKAHEKGNYRDYRKHRKEDGTFPDKAGSEMDLYNNIVGILIGNMKSDVELEDLVISFIEKGMCKIIKTDRAGNFLDCDGKIIPAENLKGKWKNEKCLVNSDDLSE